MMSALPPKADMCGATRDVRFVPKADIRSPSYCPSDQDRLHFAAASSGPGNTAKGRPQNRPCQKTTRTTIIGSATPIRKTNAVGMRAMVKWTV